MVDLKKMRIISYVWGSILVIIVIGLTVVGFIYKDHQKEYKNLEKQIEESAKKYVEEKFLYPEDKEKIKVTLEQLTSEQLIQDFKINGEDCDGYVIVYKNQGVFKYTPKIKCPKYQSPKYNKD